MNRFFILVVFFCICSCDYFDKKKVYPEDLLEEELQTFNWKDVDEYPSFESCDSATGKENKKICFENTLRSILNTSLARHQIIVSEDINDTIQLKITIDKQGQFFIDDIVSSALTKTEIPELDSLLRRSLDSLPKIYPAIKRSQQVTTKFVLPVIIAID
ncbi:hypothetical protein [Psychroserpens algicola]|uniref:TonB C-terminal domain-containing protein n=1 Tax=Psychroserpens algicola TaxID=1719034 RepID=A0ABT0H4K8_9FLAO|nr:hypothetical protein [Psychroserpens algicola]MCK8479315.1 hypothetical protein [Psychroserpens algicola]